ncbi:hypothetical protein H6G20_05925 [Desertifilum sp. FACHB-1129]|uniref:hypothetical protein n=1 Tax=unclassified Desertifilum TaxID=2621682 RepID=UPI0016838D90|nr:MULTISPECIES: hypothetical protein [unclassified Desertifilum]MBD2311195.1 hypothetical protein [Desertifilum sp. FACHB-1129]MBD2324360.1 hypothetical protein [Desertifilum sp. FACHB-866]MBD2334374.1 hypothetical protein [Desertifilum sp. FACHB-868]MDA0213221.1 hypothetical protein [Cyanobacteria bacterium FC1]
MAQSKKAKVTFLCEHELKNRLLAWGQVENRTLSNLCETAMTEAVAQFEERQKKKQDD